MSRTEKIFCAGFVVLMIVLCWGLWAHGETAPALTDTQKLAIRNAQVDYFTAKSQLEATPQYQIMNAAQAKLNEAVQKALKDAGIDQAKFQLQGDLSLLELKPVSPPKPPETKK